jgi:hypothetical protein
VTSPKFLADHDLNEQIVIGVLRRAPQATFVRVRDVGLADQLDPVIINFAAEHGFILVSHDVNTMSAAAYARMEQGQSMAGLFLAPQTSPIGSIIEDLLLVWSASDATEWEQQVVFLPFEPH